MLHIVNKSPFQNNALESCLRFLSNDDTVILIEDGVYAAMPGTEKSGLIESVMKNNKVYAISADLSARGIDQIMGQITRVDYEAFIDLIEAQPTQSWL
ncbi:MAG: sulfurtransferase complex subunit TusB [Gammaproteobacteria bacterium]|nr:sulfurtransferase complex subunit TusB [Gammaproteobacteria bacterium]MCK5092924.1 sulfurtransferase complex subunit TusB [Gammaproteobacteria bacterium]